MHIYTYVYIYTYTHTHTYTYTESERDDGRIEPEHNEYIYIYIHTYLYIYTYTESERKDGRLKPEHDEISGRVEGGSPANEVLFQNREEALAGDHGEAVENKGRLCMCMHVYVCTLKGLR